MELLPTLAALHAELRTMALRHEEIARRGGEHADREAADAVIAHRRADALETLLVKEGAIIAAEGQLSLWKDNTR